MSTALASLTETQAVKIVAALDASGQLEHPLPQSTAETMTTAQHILSGAQAAFNADVKTDVVMEILRIASEHEEPQEEDPLDKEVTIVNTTVVESPVRMHNDSSEGTVAVNSDATLLQSDQEKEPSQHNTNEAWKELPDIPRDFSKSSDLELRSLHAVCIGRLTKAIFELGIDESDYASAQVHHDIAYKQAVANAPEEKVTEKREAAFFDPEVVTWRDKVAKHHQDVINGRHMEKLLETAARGLSREWAMRSGERAAS